MASDGRSTELQLRKVKFCAVWSIGNDVVRPDANPSLASMSSAPLMLVTCKLMFWRPGLLLTLKVLTDSRLLMPMRELRPVLEMRMLFACVMPVLPKDNDCRAARAVKFIESTLVNCGMDRVDRICSVPSVKPPIDFRDPISIVARLARPVMVKLFVIFSTPLIEIA